MDGETDFLSVATREIEEETGLKAKPISENIFSMKRKKVPPTAICQCQPIYELL